MLGIRSFEDQHIKGVQSLINFSLSMRTPNPARFYFCSSISVALATPSPAIVPESVIENLHVALPMGYSRSKLVAEHIVRNAAVQAGAPAYVLRIGQIVGDSKEGVWNDTEAIPLMVRSALTLKVLPALKEVRFSLLQMNQQCLIINPASMLIHAADLLVASRGPPCHHHPLPYPSHHPSFPIFTPILQPYQSSHLLLG